MRSLVKSLALSGLVSLSIAAAWQAQSPALADDGLLSDLDAELLKGLEEPAKKPSAQSAKGAKPRPDEGGEDLGAKPENPLSKIAEKMRRVERQLEKADASKNTQAIQKEIVAELDRLIQQLQKQCASSSPPNGQPRQAKSKSPSPSKPQPGSTAATQPGKKPTGQSTQRLKRPTNAKLDPKEARQLVKAVWGHLPKRVVQQITKSGEYKFLPKYEQLIEDYFRRLAETEDP